MRNRVEIKIAGDTYTIVGEENEAHIKKVAEIVDEKFATVKRNSGLTSIQCAILAACNIAGDYLKAVENADNLRSQMKSYLEESSILRAELNDAKKEITRLRQGR